MSIDFLIISLLVLVYVPSFKSIQESLVNDISIGKNIKYLSYVFYDEKKVDSLINDYYEELSFEEQAYGDLLQLY